MYGASGVLHRGVVSPSEYDTCKVLARELYLTPRGSGKSHKSPMTLPVSSSFKITSALHCFGRAPKAAEEGGGGCACRKVPGDDDRSSRPSFFSKQTSRVTSVAQNSVPRS